MKKLYLLLLAACFSIVGRSQTSANYTFATTTTGSFTDMSSGTTQLIAADQDDIASAVTNIGFDFFLQGTRYGQFSVNSNGTLRLGATAVATTAYDPLGQAGQGLITAYGADQRTHAGDGQVHYKVTGSAPSRVLSIEWRNMQANFSSGGTADLTYQLRLYETSGMIESVYGAMAMSVAGAIDANSSSPQFGFSSGNTAGAVGTVTVAQSGTPAPAYASAAAPVNNIYTAGPITVLSSVVDGARRMFSYTPPTPSAAPTGISFTSVSAIGLTVNWTDNATNEVAYAVYLSTDGINYSFSNQVPANSVSATQTNLVGGTNYYWKVVAVTEGGVSSSLDGIQATLAAGNITSNGTGGGLWSAPGTWIGGVAPALTDNVTIQNGDVVTIETAASAYKLTVGGGTSGTLQFEAATARTMTVYTDVVINAGGTFQSSATGTQTGHSLSIPGNLTNNGTLDFSTNASTAGATIIFTGATDNTFGGTGAITNIRQLSINKGTGTTNILELNPSNFTVRGSVTDNVVGGFLTIANGTFKISGTFNYTGRMFATAAYTLSNTFTIWLNNPNFTIAAQNGNVVNNGLLRLTNGTWNVGTLNTATLTAGTGATYLIEGGTLNVAGRMTSSSAITYRQTGGTVNVATVGNSGSGTTNASFGLTSTTTSFNFSGGTINLVQASTGATPVDYINSATMVSTAGTLRAGTAATATNFNFRVRGLLPNFVVDNTTTNKTATVGAQITLLGTTTISTGATFVINGQICLISGPTFTNNGTLTGTAASTRFYFLGAGTPTTYNGTGVVTAPLLAFEIDNAAGVTIDPVANQIVTARFNNFKGGLINSNKLTIGNGGATTGTVQLGLSGVTGTVGGFDVPPVFNPGTGGVNLFYAPELTGRTMGPEVPPSRMLNQLSITNTNPITISGGDITTNTLTMSAGNIITGSNILTLGTSAAATGTYTYTTGTIVGTFRRWIAAATGNNDFPVGIAAAKRNASINFTVAPATGGTLTAQWVTYPGGSNGLPLTEGAITTPGSSSDGYWSVVAGDGLTGGTYTGTFTATGIANVTDVTQLVLLKRASAGSINPWTLDGVHVTGSGTTSVPVISRTGMTGFSEFGIGAPNFTPLPVNMLTFSGRRNGTVNELYWTTSGEKNNAGFEVQRSANGVDYSVLGFVQARTTSGNSSNASSYDFADHDPAGTVQYYRLRQVDLGDHSTYSKVITINREKAAVLTITSLNPNPAVTGMTLLVASPVQDQLAITILDISGKVVKQQMADVVAGGNSLPVDVSHLPSGMYLVKLTGNNNHEVAMARFVKQ